MGGTVPPSAPSSPHLGDTLYHHSVVQPTATAPAQTTLANPHLGGQPATSTGQNAADSDRIELVTAAPLQQPFSTLHRQASLVDAQPLCDLPDLIDIADQVAVYNSSMTNGVSTSSRKSARL